MTLREELQQIWIEFRERELEAVQEAESRGEWAVAKMLREFAETTSRLMRESELFR
jgi:uncharacterized protein YecT (DUF1311 family)